MTSDEAFDRIAAGLKDAIEIAEERADPATYRVHQPPMTHPLSAQLRSQWASQLSQAAAEELDRLSERVAELEGREPLSQSTADQVERMVRAALPDLMRFAKDDPSLPWGDVADWAQSYLRSAMRAALAAARPTDEPSTAFVYDKAPGIPLVGSIGEGGEVK